MMLLSVGFLSAQEYRTFDGVGNNQLNPDWGSNESQLIRFTTIAYGDSISSPAGENRLNPREISNALFDQQERKDDALGLSDFVWVFGQFLDHDITLVHDFNFGANPNEAALIFPPIDDPVFPPGSFIPMMRSLAANGTGSSKDNPRQHANEISSFIDGSAVYGSDKIRADWLRTFQQGKLKVSSENNLPWNTSTGEFNAPIVDSPNMDTNGFTKKYYVAGDIRANENPLLIAMHTLFVREHNLICDELIEKNPSWSDEQLYQYARKIVGGKIQSIVYNEWLPSIQINLPEYTGYNSSVNPGVFNIFSGAAFRMGHTLINSNLIRMRKDGEIISRGNINLKDAFFNPLTVDLAGGIDPYLKGMATQIQQDFDCKIVSDLRNFLFGTPGMGGLDLAAININRGRERGFPDYNTIRADFGLPRITKFSDLCIDPEVSSVLKELYGTVDDVDPWVGMLAETHLNNSLFGELVNKILVTQFRRLRDGDRFFYLNDNDLSEYWKNAIHKTRMHDLIKRNTGIQLMQEHVFKAMRHEDIPNGPEIPAVDLVAKIYPNPVKDHFYLKFYSGIDQEVDIAIIDQNGVQRFHTSQQVDRGDQSVIIHVPNDLPVGIYNVRLKGKFNFGISRFVRH